MLSRARTAPALIAAVMLFCGTAAAQASDTWSPQGFTLSNGLQAVVLPDHRAPVVTHMLWYRVGSADEAPGKSGIAHFLEHLMSKATATRKAGEFSRTIARNGGQDNAGTSYDFTNYHFRIAKGRLPEMMQMEADRMVNLQLTEDEVATERNVVQEERRQRVGGAPSATLDEMIWEKLYPGHPYAVPVIGYETEIAALSREDALGWYRQWYGPENAILVVAGDITAAELEPLAKAIYGSIPPRGDLRTRSWPDVAPLAASATVTLSDARVRQPEWWRSWLGVSLGHPDSAALQVGMEILGGRRTGRLYRQLVEGGKAVGAGGWNYELAATGPVGINVQPAPGVSVEQVQAAAMAIVDKLIADGPTPEELARAKRMLAASSIFRRDSQVETANWYGIRLTAGMSLDTINALDVRIAAVTAADVQSVLSRYLGGAHHVDGLLLPVAQ